MIVDAYGGYETGDDADPFEEEPVEVNEEIYYYDASPNPVFVCSPRVLQVSPVQMINDAICFKHGLM
jgi:hypothetical protein